MENQNYPLDQLIKDYYRYYPEKPEQQVIFGTSGHRGNASLSTFNEAHMLAISQAICDYRKKNNITGPLFLGKDTHALSECAFKTALEVFSANGITVFIQDNNGYTPTPVISYSIICYNRLHLKKADGVIITPSHNPPSDGGIKYNLTHGGPADTSATLQIQQQANALLNNSNRTVKRIAFALAKKAATTYFYDYITPYISDLNSIINMDVISQEQLKIGVDPLGGASLEYWERIADYYHLNMTLTNTTIDPSFSFIQTDKEGYRRMDCSTEIAMSSLIKLRAQFDIAFGNDPDADRHGIVTKNHGLLNPINYLVTAIDFLCRHRKQWPIHAGIGKTLVSSGMIDLVARTVNRPFYETPVGFKWFVQGLHSQQLVFAGEESAGASFLRKDGTTWSTDKDGFIAALLAAEITAVTHNDPSIYYEKLAKEYHVPIYYKKQIAANYHQKRILSNLTPKTISAKELAHHKITFIQTTAPSNNENIGGIKIITDQGWCVIRPSGTEDFYKIYAESFIDDAHAQLIITHAEHIIQEAFT